MAYQNNKKSGTKETKEETLLPETGFLSLTSFVWTGCELILLVFVDIDGKGRFGRAISIEALEKIWFEMPNKDRTYAGTLYIA